MSTLIISDQRMLEAIDRLLNQGVERHQKDICEAIGIEPQRISKIRSGKQHFIAENIRLMAKVYKVNLNYIFGFEDRFFTKKRVNKNINKAFTNSLKLENSLN